MTTGLALALANLRYWTSVAPIVREQLLRWEQAAQAIPDPALREIARDKLRAERLNVEMAATMATLAKPPYRRDVVQAIVALQVMYDYLDLLTEGPLADSRSNMDFLYKALTDAVTPEPRATRDYYPQSSDGAYLWELVGAVRDALAKLPATSSVGDVMLRSASRCAQAQVRWHTCTETATAEIEQWARQEAKGTDLQWPEMLAGACASVLALHALITAAADERTTQRDAEDLDAAYLSICALTMLDSVVDQAHDLATGELNYVRIYESHQLMATRVAHVAREAKNKAQRLPNSSHHVVTLVGIVAYYCSAIDNLDTSMRQIAKPVRRELRPLMTPTLTILRAWRLANSVRGRLRIAPAERSGLERLAG